MPLPVGGNVRWPPESWAQVFRAYDEWGAWFSGDPDRLATFYGEEQAFTQRTQWWKFWARQRPGKEGAPRSQMHVPLASDIAATSASILFAEAPLVSVPEAHGDTENPEAVAAEERLIEIFEQSNLHATLLEAAETAAALGGIFVRVAWDREVANYPFLSPVDVDAALPEFRWGQLTAVTFWRVLERTDNGSKVLRHLERYEPGLILHGLYRGTTQNLGDQIDLKEHTATENLEPSIGLPDRTLAVRYIPNNRPNRRFRNMMGSALGASDFAGAEGMLDALDECWTNWMRDIRLGRARLLIPEEYLEKAGDKLKFDIDQEVFVPLNIAPGDNPNQGIQENQFTIRFEEHSRTAQELIERITATAGYSPQTFGLRIEGRAESGTALRIRERKTLSTQQKKRRYWEQPLADLLEIALLVDGLFLGNKTPVMRPRVDLADSIQPDPKDIAETIAVLHNAQSASVEVRVRMAHPDWSEDELAAEVERLNSELGMLLPDLDNLGGAGAGAGEGEAA